MLRLGSLAFVACLFVLAGGVAQAAKPQQAVFRATLTATLTKEWTFTTSSEDGSCVRTVRGSGRWEAKLSASRPARVRAIPLSGGRVRFSGALAALRGSSLRSGSTTTVESGAPPCERTTRAVRCAPQRLGLSNASSSIRNPRRGVAQLAALRGVAAARVFPSQCGVEPDDIRAIRTDLPLATAPIDRADVFDPQVRRFFLTGDTEQITTLEGELEGRVTERVRWRLVFTRL